MHSSFARRSGTIMARHSANVLLAFRALARLLERSVDTANGFVFGTYSTADEADLAVSLLPDSGAVVVDAGANDGAWSAALLRRAKPQQVSAVLLIEPNELYMRAHADLKREFGCIKGTEWLALGRQSGIAKLFHDPANARHASLYDRRTMCGAPTQATQTAVAPLGELVARHDIAQIDFLKLDVEGHELEALTGAGELLHERKIGAIQFEFGGANVDSRTFVRDFWDLLVRGHGYTLYRLVPGRRLRMITEYSVTLERFVWQNMLACAPGRRPGWPCD
jgi:FkbM family methyltransferase